MNLGVSAEQQELRESVRRFLADRAPLSRVRELMETADGSTGRSGGRRARSLACRASPSRRSTAGSGFSFAEQAIVLEELGAGLYGGPYLASAVLAATALLAARTRGPGRSCCRASPSGETIATLAFTEDDGSWDPACDPAGRGEAGDGWRAGRAQELRAGRRRRRTSSSWSPRAGGGCRCSRCDAAAAGLTRTALPTLDQTRNLARLSSPRVPARLIGSPGDGRARARATSWTWRRSRWLPSSSAARSGRWTWRWSTPRSGISSAGRSAVSRRSSTGAPTC